MDALITTLLVVALFVLLGSGVWIGLALAGVEMMITALKNGSLTDALARVPSSQDVRI